MKMSLVVRISLTIFTVYALIVSSAVFAETKEASLNVSVYSALVECVDDMFYEGGYMVGNKEREAFMTDVLALKNQPAYSEELMEKIRESEVVLDEYRSAFSECISGDLYEKVDALAKKHGIEYYE